MNMLPKPTGGRLPMLITGPSRQDPDWIAASADGWMTYPRPTVSQARVLADWRARVAETSDHAKPLLQPLYSDLADDPDEAPRPIHLGFRSGAHALADYLRDLQGIGVSHDALKSRFNRAEIDTTQERLAETILPEFTD